MDDNKFTSCVGMLVSLFILVILAVAMNGWALATIWNWFIPPIFGITTLTIAKAIGVSMVIELFTGTNNLSKSSSSSNKSLTDAFIESGVKAIVVPVFTVGLAWVVFQFAF